MSGLKLLAEPVCGTLGPRGKNALFEDQYGNMFVTNDGVTIAKQIESEDPIEDVVIRTVRHASLATNGVAGDGTTTTTLYSDFFIREGLKLKDDGMNEMVLKDYYKKIEEEVISSLKPIQIKNEEDLLKIATVSANNDANIAQDVVKIVKSAGESGMVFINPSSNGKTEVIEDNGYVINNGVFDPVLFNDGPNKASYENVHVLVTDKRLYYEEECQHILALAIENGIQNLVIVARDFIGKAPNFLLGNHVNGFINLLLVKHSEASETNNTPLSDLALYLGGKLVTEKSGKLIGRLTAEDFIVAQKVYATRDRAVFQSMNTETPELVALVDYLKSEKEKDKDNKEVEKRLSSLTNGVVTVNVGGTTPIEVQENIFRYEDSINAARAAMKYGYLPGGGLALLNATSKSEDKLVRKLGEVSIRQIARNCGEHEDSIVKGCSGDVGYDAKNNTFTNLVEAGVIDPYKVTELAIRNSISVAIAILTSGFIIVNKKDNGKEDKGKD